MRVGIVGQRDNDRAVAIVETLLEDVFADRPAEPIVDQITADALSEHDVPTEGLADSELAISIGGDGTFLYTAHRVGSVPLLGINLGEVGFLTTVSPSAAVETVAAVLDDYRDETLSVRSLSRLSVSLADRHIGTAVNEAVIQRPSRGPPQDGTVSVAIDDSRYTSETADGVLVSTPTGSTAYNLSEGGPLVHPRAGVLVVTPMAPGSGTRPLIVEDSATITVTVSSAAYLVIDGRDRHRVDPETTVTVRTASAPLQVVMPEFEFFDALEKLR